MFTILEKVLKNRNNQALVLDLTCLPSWLREQEESYREEFRRAAGDNVSRILLHYAEIRDPILPLRTNLLFTDDGNPGSAAVCGLLERFENAPAVLYSGTPGDDIAGFCRDADDVCRCCESCLADYGTVLAPDYQDLVAALRKGSVGIMKQVRLMSPAVEKYCSRSARVAELQRTYMMLYTITGSVRSSVEEEIRAGTRIAAYRQQIAAIDADLQQIGAGPGSPEEKAEVLKRERENVRDDLAQSYRNHALILQGITIRAEDLALSREDDIAAGVFQILREILDGEDVPESDALFSALIDAFPIFMDLIDEGALTLSGESEREAFTDIASFTNGLQDICSCYHDMNAEGNHLSVPCPETPEERRQELSREREAIQAKVLAESDHILHAHVIRTVTADDRTDLVQKIEEEIRMMTGRPAQILPENSLHQA